MAMYNTTSPISHSDLFAMTALCNFLMCVCVFFIIIIIIIYLFIYFNLLWWDILYN